MSDPVNKITVEIDLDEAVRQRWRSHGFEDDRPEEPIDLAGLVIDEAARQLTSDRVIREATSELMQRVREVRLDLIREQVRHEITTALSESIQPTDSYGSPKGQPTTLREIIVKEAQAALNQRGDYGRGKTLVQELIAKEVNATFERELRAALTEAKQQVVQAVHQKGAKMLAGTIADMAETVTERQVAASDDSMTVSERSF